MRLRVLAFVALVVFAPRPAEACCAEVPCPETERWRTLKLHDEGPVPRDGVLLFSGWTDSERCIDALAPLLEIEVRRGDEVLAGQLELADGRGSSFVWRPEVPWEPGAHHVRVKIDNDASGPPAGLPEDVPACPPDCPDPAVVLIDVDFTVGAEFSPPIPSLVAPALSLEVTKLDRTMADITCCPGVVPTQDCCGGAGCWPTWEEGECVAIYEQGRMVIDVPPHLVPPELSAQILYELRADGAVIDRQFDAERLAMFDRRLSPACMQVVALHMGNGETVASGTICPPDQLSQQLGVRPVDVAAALACAEPVRCGLPGGTWEPEACAPYDPLALPPPPAVPPDSTLAAACPRAQGPWLSPETGDGPTTGPGDPGTTGGGDPATAGGDGLVDHGCACAEGRGRPSALALLSLLFVRRRRRAG